MDGLTIKPTSSPVFPISADSDQFDNMDGLTIKPDRLPLRIPVQLIRPT
ncbi:hypothetical protein A2U01_0022888, partial [Trifolium medium]|nr:hypothetical protein [Trifolium medium]